MPRIKKSRHFKKPRRGLSVRVEQIRETEIISDYETIPSGMGGMPDTYDTIDGDVEDHVAPFIKELADIKSLERLNLTSKSGALEALAIIDKALETINTKQRTALALKTMLEEKKNRPDPH